MPRLSYHINSSAEVQEWNMKLEQMKRTQEKGIETEQRLEALEAEGIGVGGDEEKKSSPTKDKELIIKKHYAIKLPIGTTTTRKSTT